MKVSSLLAHRRPSCLTQDQSPSLQTVVTKAKEVNRPLFLFNIDPELPSKVAFVNIIPKAIVPKVDGKTWAAPIATLLGGKVGFPSCIITSLAKRRLTVPLSFEGWRKARLVPGCRQRGRQGRRGARPRGQCLRGEGWRLIRSVYGWISFLLGWLFATCTRERNHYNEKQNDEPRHVEKGASLSRAHPSLCPAPQ